MYFVLLKYRGLVFTELAKVGPAYRQYRRTIQFKIDHY